MQVYVHAPEDVPFANHGQDEKVLLNWGSTFTMVMQVRILFEIHL